MLYVEKYYMSSRTYICFQPGALIIQTLNTDKLFNNN